MDTCPFGHETMAAMDGERPVRFCPRCQSVFDIKTDITEVITETAFMTMIRRRAMAKHWMVYHTRDSRGSDPGFPDLVLAKPGRPPIYLEVKRAGGRVSREQTAWLEALPNSHLVYPNDWDLVKRLIDEKHEEAGFTFENETVAVFMRRYFHDGDDYVSHSPSRVTGPLSIDAAIDEMRRLREEEIERRSHRDREPGWYEYEIRLYSP